MGMRTRVSCLKSRPLSLCALYSAVIACSKTRVENASTESVWHENTRSDVCVWLIDKQRNRRNAVALTTRNVLETRVRDRRLMIGLRVCCD